MTLTRAVTALTLTWLTLAPVLAHDHWINGTRNAAGEWCCGEADCKAILGVRSVSIPPGWRLPSGEFIPQSETLPSQDGQFWSCHRPDGVRRCFFAPPPAM